MRRLAIAAVSALLAGCPDPGVAGAVASTSSAGGAGTGGGATASSSASSGGAGGAPSCADDLPTGADGLGLYDRLEQRFYLLRPGGGTSDFFVDKDDNSSMAFPVAGRWTGGAFDHLGIYEPDTTQFRLRIAETNDPPAFTFAFGAMAIGNFPCAGDWGSGPPDKPTPALRHSGIGVYVEQTAVANFKRDNSAGPADYAFTLGAMDNDYLPACGDFDKDGIDTLALYVRTSPVFYVKNTHTDGAADETITFEGAQPEWLPVVGDWDADGIDDLGLYDKVKSEFHLRLSEGQYRCVQFGEPGKERLPVAGTWEP